MSALVLFAAGLSTTFLISIGVVRYSVLRCGSRCSNCAAMQIARSSGLYSQTQPWRWSQQFLPCRSTPPRNRVFHRSLRLSGKSSGESQDWCSPC